MRVCVREGLKEAAITEPYHTHEGWVGTEMEMGACLPAYLSSADHRWLPVEPGARGGRRAQTHRRRRHRARTLRRLFVLVRSGSRGRRGDGETSACACAEPLLEEGEERGRGGVGRVVGVVHHQHVLQLHRVQLRKVLLAVCGCVCVCAVVCV